MRIFGNKKRFVAANDTETSEESNCIGEEGKV